MEPLDRILVVVNNDVITTSDLDHEMKTIVNKLQQKGIQLPPRRVLAKQVLERLIIKRLQLQLADRTGLKVDEATLNETLRRVARQNHMGLLEFSELLENQGFNFEQFREDIRNELTIARLQRREVDNRVTVSDREIDDYLETEGRLGASNDRLYHLRHILVAVPDGASPEQIQSARSKAEGILEELQGGADFAQVATAKSDGTNALEGGDLGERRLSEIPTLFLDTVTTLKPGQISDLIRSPSGFHIIKLIDISGDEKKVITQTKVRHILIHTDDLANDAEVRKRLLHLKQRIEGGEDFHALARAHSDDKASAIKGGELGWVNPGAMLPQFEEVMDKTDVGKVSAPFHTKFGWHILQVEGRRQYDSTEEYQRNQARKAIRKRKIEEQRALWLRRLRDEAYVEYRNDNE